MPHDSPTRRFGATARPVRVDASGTGSDGVSLWPLYDAVFSDWPHFEAWRCGVWDIHSARAGFRLVRAYSGADLIGFAYGYTGQPGQWWTDHARAVLDRDVADAWLGGHFELVSIGVLDRARGTGVGRALLACLTKDLDQERWLLMTTDDASDPARRLYASNGWNVVGPGIGDGQVIMAKRRP